MAADKPMTKLVRPLRGGQITIPAEFRRRLGIREGTMLRVTLDEQELRITPVQVTEGGAGSPWLRELYDLFAPVREEILERAIPAAEVDADIDTAIKAARAARHAAQR